MAQGKGKAKAKRPEITIHGRCRHCGRVQSRRGSQGIYWRCKNPDCRGLNPGPAMEKALGATPPVRRRRPREQPAPAAAGSRPGQAAPVRRKPKAARPAAGMVTEETSGPRRRDAPETPAPAAPPAPAASARRGIVDRLLGYGDDEP